MIARIVTARPPNRIKRSPRPPGSTTEPARIVTERKAGSTAADPNARADAADRLWRELVRRVTASGLDVPSDPQERQAE